MIQAFEPLSAGLEPGVAEPFPLRLERPLGAEVTQSGTQFALWAPSATNVTLRLFTRGSDTEAGDQLIDSITMRYQEDDGTWVYESDDNMHGTYYDYVLTMQDGSEYRSADPWARAAGVNGRRSMVVDLSRTNPEGWQEDTHPQTPLHDLMVWEAHVGSFSNNPHGGFPKEHQGKYLAFTDTDTSLDNEGEFPTGIAYLKQLGVSAVQLLPFYDYGSVDESDPRQFNWGYDPLNYNVPEGSFSTNPYDGATRILECKRMIQSLHANGFSVIMDVVYNHMYSADNWFERTVPGYFLRRNDDGTLANGSGCGDDMATERAMFRRFIVESVTYWAREYHVDGFRFDLMGLIDIETMNAIRASLDALPGGKTIIMYGEPWAAGATRTLEGTQLADKSGLHALDPRIGHFCDRTRDAIKGHVFYPELKGYVNGDAHNNKPLIEFAHNAWRNEQTYEGNAGQIIQYVSAHDDLTLWDKLCMSMYGEDPILLDNLFEAAPSDEYDRVLTANKLAAGIIYTAAGIPFMLSGEEFGKTKFGNDNSFDSGKRVNQIDWLRASRMTDLLNYYRSLIALRRKHTDWFDAEHITLPVDGNAVAFRVNDTAVLINPDETATQLNLQTLNQAAESSAENAQWYCELNSAGEKLTTSDTALPMPAQTLSIWSLGAGSDNHE